MIAEREELFPGFEDFLRQFSRPVVVDIGGEEHHANTFRKAACPGTLICVNPKYGIVAGDPNGGNVLYVPGGYEGVGLPKGIADEVQLNFVVTFVSSFALPFIDVVTATITTARSFVKPGVYLEVLDTFRPLQVVAGDLRKKRFQPELRQLDSYDPDDRKLYYERSYHAPMHESVGLGLLRIPL